MRKRNFEGIFSSFDLETVAQLARTGINTIKNKLEISNVFPDEFWTMIANARIESIDLDSSKAEKVNYMGTLLSG